MVFTISDMHFNHANIIKYCSRPFEDAAHMNEMLIHNWNSVVSEEDTVINCGDFILGLADTIHDILPRLNGKIILVQGNHDLPRKIQMYREEYPDKIEIHPMYIHFEKGTCFVFCHFPLTSEELLKMSFGGQRNETIFVSGHLHDKTPFYNAELKIFNVGAENTRYAPVSLRTLRRYHGYGTTVQTRYSCDRCHCDECTYCPENSEMKRGKQ